MSHASAAASPTLLASERSMILMSTSLMQGAHCCLQFSNWFFRCHRQLKQVARLIAARDERRAERDVFYASWMPA